MTGTAARQASTTRVRMRSSWVVSSTRSMFAASFGDSQERLFQGLGLLAHGRDADAVRDQRVDEIAGPHSGGDDDDLLALGRGRRDAGQAAQYGDRLLGVLCSDAIGVGVAEQFVQ